MSYFLSLSRSIKCFIASCALARYSGEIGMAIMPWSESWITFLRTTAVDCTVVSGLILRKNNSSFLWIHHIKHAQQLALQFHSNEYSYLEQ
jgi:hypothetical protein